MARSAATTSCFGELLISNKGGRKRLLADYERMRQAPAVPHREVVAFVRQRRLRGRGVGWIDAHLLASTLVGRLRFVDGGPAPGGHRRRNGVSYD